MRTFLLILLISIVGCSEDPIIEPLYEDLILGNWQNVEFISGGQSLGSISDLKVEVDTIKGLAGGANYTIEGDSIELYFGDIDTYDKWGIFVDSENLELSTLNAMRIYKRIEQ